MEGGDEVVNGEGKEKKGGGGGAGETACDWLMLCFCGATGVYPAEPRGVPGGGRDDGLGSDCTRL